VNFGSYSDDTSNNGSITFLSYKGDASNEVTTGSVSGAGAWTIGPSTKDQTAIVNGNLRLDSNTGSNTRIDFYENGVAKQVLYAYAPDDSFRLALGGVDQLMVTSAGAVTIGLDAANGDVGLQQMNRGIKNLPARSYGVSPDTIAFSVGSENAAAVNSAAIYQYTMKATGSASGYILRMRTLARDGSWADGPYVSGTAWVDASDASLKKDIIDIGYGLAETLLLKPRAFNWKADNKAAIGFIAQEVSEVMPELVDNNTGTLGLSYGHITAVLTKAIQELSSLLTETREQLDAANARIEALKAA
jgi:hypothetical protein